MFCFVLYIFNFSQCSERERVREKKIRGGLVKTKQNEEKTI